MEIKLREIFLKTQFHFPTVLNFVQWGIDIIYIEKGGRVALLRVL